MSTTAAAVVAAVIAFALQQEMHSGRSYNAINGKAAEVTRRLF